jgi:hypothetical protein
VKTDIAAVLLFCMWAFIVVLGFGFLAYLFISVIYLGEGSSCPQNLC